MKRNSKGAKRRRQTVRIWSHEEARTALPYLASIVRSLREHKLEANAQELRARQLANLPGRPDRVTLIALEEARKAAQEAEARFQDALFELQSLDIYCLDPIAGQALIPFVQDEQLAWFIYDLFDAEPLQFWRYHSDDLETRRPLREIQKGSGENTFVA
jgi:hypothetical protein